MDISTCCPVVRDAPLTMREAERTAAAFKVLADPARLRLLSLIAASSDEGCCVCELTGPVKLSQPTVSHHLKVLHDAGLVSREKRGTWAYFRVIPDALAGLADVLRPAARV